jgi:hypothetical protein
MPIFPHSRVFHRSSLLTGNDQSENESEHENENDFLGETSSSDH